jgi:ABC-2 type transport system permease protein
MATAAIGLYSVAATLFWGRVLFGVPLDFVHPWLFALALPAAVIGLGLLGLVMASTFVLYRNANAFANLLEYPVWLVTGLLVPLSLLPGWVEPISWVLAPTWGVEAVRTAAGVEDGDPGVAIGMCLLLSAVYLAIGFVTMANFERLARQRATLSLT